jgi:hypothetical protein
MLECDQRGVSASFHRLTGAEFSSPSHSVIPAEAGAFRCVAASSISGFTRNWRLPVYWIPAFAGMTKQSIWRVIFVGSNQISLSTK